MCVSLVQVSLSRFIVSVCVCLCAFVRLLIGILSSLISLSLTYRPNMCLYIVRWFGAACNRITETGRQTRESKNSDLRARTK